MSGVVVYATASVLRAAERLGFPGVIENATRDAVAAGRQFRRFPGGGRLVDLGDGWVACTKTKDRTPAGVRRLLVTSLERTGGHTTHTRKGNKR